MSNFKEFKKKFPLRAKSVLLILLITLVLSGSVLFVSQRNFSHNNDERFRTQATELATTVSAVVDAKKVSALRERVSAVYDAIPDSDRVGSDGMGTPEYDAYLEKFAGIEESEEFKDLYAVLRGIQDSNTVESVYIIYVDTATASTVYLVDASDDPCATGNFDPVFEENRQVLTRPEKGFPAYITNLPEYGWLVSAGIPIFDGDRVCAHAFVDISMNAVKAEESAFLVSLSIMLLILMLIICLIAILAVDRTLVKPVNRLSDAASSYYSDDTNIKASFAALEIHTGDEIENLSLAMKQMEQDMNAYIQDLTAVTREKERIGAELNIATQIQADMLPRIFPPFPDRTEFDIFASMSPAKEVGGDFYDFFLVDENHLGLVMADVSGKGVPAALFMVIAKTLIKNRAQMGGGPGEILEYVNEQLCEGNDAELFVTVWFAILDIRTGKGVAANAGHEHPALRRAGGKFELITYRHSPAVAVVPGMRFREHEFELHPGDSLFVYTDGVTEATDAQNRLFGTDLMLSALNREPDAPAEKLLRNVRADIDSFVGSAPQFDDITMLGLIYTGTEEQNNG